MADRSQYTQKGPPTPPPGKPKGPPAGSIAPAGGGQAGPGGSQLKLVPPPQTGSVPKPNPASPAEQDRDPAATKRELEASRASTLRGADRGVESVTNLAQQVRAPTKGKYYLVGFFAALVDIATIFEEGFGGDFTGIGLLIKWVVKFIVFLGFFYLAYQDKKYAEFLEGIESDVQGKTEHLRQRAQVLTQRANQYRGSNTRGKIRAMQSQPAPSLKSIIKNPYQTLIWWLLAFIPGIDLLPFETYGVYKLYQTTHKNYEAIIEYLEYEYAQAVQGFESAIAEQAQAEEEYYDQAA